MPTSTRTVMPGAAARVGSRVFELLEASGHDVMPISRSTGVDLVLDDGLAEAFTGAGCVIDAASDFVTASASNLDKTGSFA